ncbi:hypothetical protein GCM10008955_31390 [Deinococcus malanensis]|uniref:Uncharacterized protein n=1 Tax=Deinococcus malanensis TaxID=1706855 RepID=A0ABQ2F357_9DEIO|nr:hypothetical protein GCM10008955_31390 [Deinococcus malanensis]
MGFPLHVQQAVLVRCEGGQPDVRGAGQAHDLGMQGNSFAIISEGHDQLQKDR